jgi:hypothetical protein
MVWKPRGSALGSYLACPWRAANDRAIAEGKISPEQAKEIGLWEETGYAPHGSIIHWVTQVGIGGIFLGREPTIFEAHEAAEPWGGDVEAAKAAAAKGEDVAAARVMVESQPVNATRTEGQMVKADWEIEVTNPFELARYHPDCVTIEPRLSVIKAALNEGREIKGIKATKVTRAGVRLAPAPKAIDV